MELLVPVWRGLHGVVACILKVIIVIILSQKITKLIKLTAVSIEANRKRNLLFFNPYWKLSFFWEYCIQLFLSKSSSDDAT